MVRKHIIPIFLVLFLGIIAFWPSFGLSLFGDDWLVLYIYKYQVVHNSLSPTSIDFRSLLSPYGPTYFLMGIINNYFGLNPVPYFTISLFFRSLATIGIYMLIFKITKNRLSAIASSSFWAISAIGIESTNWVFNMNSYLGIAIFLAVVILIIKYHETSKMAFLWLGGLMFVFSVIAVPVRMHGAFIVLFLIETYYLLTNWQKGRAIKKFIIVNSVLVMSFFVLSSWGVFGSGSSNFDIYVGKGLKENASAIENGHYEQFLYPLTTIGNMLFTDQYMNKVQIPRIIYRGTNLSWMGAFLIPLFVIISGILVSASLLLVDKRKVRAYALTILFSLFVLILIINTFIRAITNTMLPGTVFLTLAGGAFLFFTTLLIIFTSQTFVKNGLIIGLFWLFGFAAVPIIFTPLTYIPSGMRYLIIAGIAIPIIIGMLFSINKSVYKNILLILFVLPLYFIQYSSTQSYLNNLLLSRSEDISQEVWKNIFAAIPSIDYQKDYLFYFEPNTENGSVVLDVINFGFIPRMIFYEKSPNKPGSLLIIDKREEFVSAIKDGEKLKAYNWGLAKKIDKENAFAFRLEKDYSLTDIKSEILYGTR